jgi:hypothetical protein
MIAMLNRATRMVLALLNKVGFMRCFWSFESSNEAKNLIDSDVGKVTTSGLCYTKKPGLVIGVSNPLVFSIRGGGRNSQVCNPVIVLDPVEVINSTIRKASIDVQPRKTMCLKRLLVNLNYYVSTATNKSSMVATLRAIFNVFGSSEVSGFWIVVKKFAQQFCGNIGLSHDAPYQQIGQRPDSVCSGFGPRHFNTMVTT